MKNSTFVLKVNSLMSSVYDAVYPDDDSLPDLSKPKMLECLKTLLEPAAINLEILRMCRGLMSSDDGQKVFGTDELTDARVSAKLACCIMSHIKQTLWNQKPKASASTEKMKRSYGHTHYSFPIVPEDYVLKELFCGKTEEYEFTATWEVKYFDRQIGTVSFAKREGSTGSCQCYHYATGATFGSAGSILRTLQEALNLLMVEDDVWIKNDLHIQVPKGFKVQRVIARTHQYLISRRGHMIGEISWLSSDENDRKPNLAGFMWTCYKSDDCDDGVPNAQEAVDLLIQCHIAFMEGKK